MWRGAAGSIPNPMPSGLTIPSPTFTGQSLFAQGSNTAPSIAYAGDTDTGWWFPAANSIAFASASASRVMFNASGQAFKSDMVLGWSSNDPTAQAMDVTVARIATASAAITTGRWSVKQGAAVASAGEITLGSDGNRFQITGTTQIDKILITGWQAGSIVTLHFQGSVTVTHNTANNGSFHGLRLAGAANFSATANDQLTLQYDSTSTAWFEIARCVI